MLGVCVWLSVAGGRESIARAIYWRPRAAAADNTLGYTATHYFSSEASSRVVTDRPGEVVVGNVKIAWAESGAQSLMGGHIYQVTGRGPALPAENHAVFSCVRKMQKQSGLDSLGSVTTQHWTSGV